MEFTPDVLQSIDKSVLCWLATVSTDNAPNVSPKEVFKAWENNQLIIANIASPQSVRNIKANPAVCVSMIDIFIQKGYKLQGKAGIVTPKMDNFEGMEAALLEITKGQFPFRSIIQIRVDKISPIIAPSYFLFPEISEQDQIENAKKTYGI